MRSHLHVKSDTVKLIEAGSGMEVLGAWRGGNEEVMVKGYKVSVMQNKFWRLYSTVPIANTTVLST